MKPNHAWGFCIGCYTSIFHIEKVKSHNRKKYFGIPDSLYYKLTKECVLCGFDKIIDLHHLDHNRTNNSTENLIGLCPNHHKMIHDRRFQKEIFEELKAKGFNIQETYKEDKFYKKNLTGTIHKNKLDKI